MTLRRFLRILVALVLVLSVMLAPGVGVRQSAGARPYAATQPETGGLLCGAAVNYAVGLSPVAVAVGDFNGDGKLDLVSADDVGNGTVSVLLGNGNGTFQSQVTYAVGVNPQSVAVGDFNGDGKLDLAVANGVSNTVSVLLGNGNGAFQPQITYAVGSGPFSVAVGDFNGDGKLDLVTANSFSNTVSVLLGNGNGAFQLQITYAVGVNPNLVAVGDFNGDGKLDLVAVNNGSNTVSVLLGNGNGAFQPQITYAVGPLPRAVAVGDFNGDGKLDLVTANSNSTTVSVLLSGRPCLTVSPTSGFFKSSIVITGTTFAPNETVNIYADSTTTAPLTTTTAGTDGSFVLHGTVRQGPYGPHTLIAQGQGSGLVGTTSFFETARLLLPPYSGAVGSTVQALGFGFAAGEQVKVYWNTPRQFLGTVTANALGSFYGATALTVTVPVGAPLGANLVFGVGQTQTSHALGTGVVLVH